MTVKLTNDLREMLLVESLEACLEVNVEQQNTLQRIQTMSSGHKYYTPYR